MNNFTARDYEIRLFWSPPDEAFVAHPVEWPAISAVGDTCEEAAREIQVALELALEVAREKGITIPQPARLSAVTA